MAYYSGFFVFDQQKPRRAVLRNYTEADFDELIKVQSECFPSPFPEELWWNREQLNNHVTLFPEGAICVEVNGQLAGSLTTLCVNFDPAHPKHSWSEITDDGYIRNHQGNGNTLYVVDISIRPKYRKFGLGKWMMLAMYQLVIEKKLDRLLGAGRIPGFKRVSGRMTAKEYVEKVLSGELNDPVISFLLKCGRTPIAVVEDYLEDDESQNCGVLMEWKNPFK
ncbi:GNAT family N-acetyltransferase [Peribacillus asahii]|uniref:GNAT family N-acetyltransferase n=1 Tax=Peribacillus asahii TaxID=228899 RepID=UPI002079D3A7|nr:GNAT family N-acetyltransferase [Peribacillus asahii]USK58285.1 GNAT family N-acetyltransferase [Peribacillus asahii]